MNLERNDGRGSVPEVNNTLSELALDLFMTASRTTLALQKEGKKLLRNSEMLLSGKDLSGSTEGAPVKLPQLSKEQLKKVTHWSGLGCDGDPNAQGLIERLQHNSYKVREESSAELRGLGVAVLPSLTKALTEKKLDVEGSVRAEQIIDEVVTAKLAPLDDKEEERGSLASGAVGLLLPIVDKLFGRAATNRAALEEKLQLVERFVNDPALTNERVEIDRQLLAMHARRDLQLPEHVLDSLRRELHDLQRVKSYAADLHLKLAFAYGEKEQQNVEKAAENILKAAKLDKEKTNTIRAATLICRLELDKDEKFMTAYRAAGGDPDCVRRAAAQLQTEGG